MSNQPATTQAIDQDSSPTIVVDTKPIVDRGESPTVIILAMALFSVAVLNALTGLVVTIARSVPQ